MTSYLTVSFALHATTDAAVCMTITLHVSYCHLLCSRAMFGFARNCRLRKECTSQMPNSMWQTSDSS